MRRHQGVLIHLKLESQRRGESSEKISEETAAGNFPNLITNISSKTEEGQ